MSYTVFKQHESRKALAWKALGVGAVLVLAQNNSRADDDTAAAVAAAADAPAVVKVTGHALKSKDKAQLALDDVPGGTSLISADEVEKGRVFTNEDVLAYQPGVYAQSAGGSDGIKISIRGSSINRGTNFFRSGILFLFDGLPVSGPGGTPYELFEPLGLSYTEVLRGANAFNYGNLTLGGAINYVTRTGYDAAPFEARLEAGSFGYRKEQLSSGGVIGNLDYYISLTDSRRDGYQDQSAGTSAGVVANVGYKFNADLSTRFYVRYRQTNNESPGALTKAQIDADPTQANPVSVTQNAYRKQPGSTWIGNKTTYVIDGDSKIEAGLVWHNYPIDIEGGVNAGVWGMRDLSASLQYSRQDRWNGHRSDTQVGLLSTTHLDAWQNTVVRIPTGVTAALPVGTVIRHANYGGSDTVLHASNDLEVVPDWWLTTGVSALRTKRSTDVSFPVTNATYDSSKTSLAPRLGLRWDWTPTTQLYANVSRSVEPPNSWAILTTPPAFTSGPATGLASQGLDLRDQTANTVEIGGRGKVFDSDWALSLYHSEVRNELLTVEVIAATATVAAQTAESNASPTVHQGVEASLNSKLGGGLLTNKDKLSLRQAFTLNDFYFKHDSKFGHNTLPGIPRQFYQADLQYDHPGGFYASLNTQLASKIQVDYANSYQTQGYGIYGATLGFDHPSGDWKAYVDFRNIGNKHYAATVSPAYDDAGTDQRRSSPGDGFGVFAGVTVTFH